jgi:hypothetical protein
VLIYEGLAGFWHRLTRRAAPSPAEAWLKQRVGATLEQVIAQHVAAINAHDLDWILTTLAPERARLYNDHRTVDRRRLSIREMRLVDIDSNDPGDSVVPISPFAARYANRRILKVTYTLTLKSTEERRDPSLHEGEQWAYFILVNEGPRKPWLIVDWGR